MRHSAHFLVMAGVAARALRYSRHVAVSRCNRQRDMSHSCHSAVNASAWLAVCHFINARWSHSDLCNGSPRCGSCAHSAQGGPSSWVMDRHGVALCGRRIVNCQCLMQGNRMRFRRRDAPLQPRSGQDSCGLAGPAIECRGLLAWPRPFWSHARQRHLQLLRSNKIMHGSLRPGARQWGASGSGPVMVNVLHPTKTRPT